MCVYGQFSYHLVGLIGEVEAILNTRWLERDFRTIQRVIKALLEWRPLFDGDFPIFDGDRTCRYFSGPKMEKMFQEVGIDQPLWVNYLLYIKGFELLTLLPSIREFKGAYESIRMVLREDQNKVHYVTSLTMNTLRTIGMILGLVFTGRQVHDYKMVLTKVPSYDRGTF